MSIDGEQVRSVTFYNKLAPGIRQLVVNGVLLLMMSGTSGNWLAIRSYQSHYSNVCLREEEDKL